MKKHETKVTVLSQKEKNTARAGRISKDFRRESYRSVGNTMVGKLG